MLKITNFGRMAWFLPLVMLLIANLALAQEVRVDNGVAYISAKLIPKKMLVLEQVKICFPELPTTKEEMDLATHDFNNNKIGQMSQACPGSFANCKLALEFKTNEIAESLFLHLETTDGGKCERQEISNFQHLLKVNRYEYDLLIDQPLAKLIAKDPAEMFYQVEKIKSSTFSGYQAGKSGKVNYKITLKYDNLVTHDEILIDGVKFVLSYSK